MSQERERLHKVLASSGLGSRRALEERIAAGEVQVNGRQAVPGTPVQPGDRVEIDGRGFRVVTRSEDSRLIAYNKPEGELTTRSDPEGRPTVFERLPRLHEARWVAVGRLDINTSGLLLLTDDGELANALMHPSNAVEREYLCRIHGQPELDTIERLRQGVQLDDGPARFDRIEPMGASASHQWYQVVLHEGRNREVRRLWEAVGFQVSRLKRVRYGDITLPRLLRRGQAQELPAHVVNRLRAKLGLAQRPEQLVLEPDARIRRVQKAVRERSAGTANVAAHSRRPRASGPRPSRPRQSEEGGGRGCEGQAPRGEFRRSSTTGSAADTGFRRRASEAARPDTGRARSRDEHPTRSGDHAGPRDRRHGAAVSTGDAPRHTRPSARRDSDSGRAAGAARGGQRYDGADRQRERPYSSSRGRELSTEDSTRSRPRPTRDEAGRLSGASASSTRAEVRETRPAEGRRGPGADRPERPPGSRPARTQEGDRPRPSGGRPPAPSDSRTGPRKEGPLPGGFSIERRRPRKP